MQNLATSNKQTTDSVLLALSTDITSCRSYADVQDILTNRISKYFQFNEAMVCLNNSDNLTHNCYAHTVSPATISNPEFARGSGMKYFINDGIFNIIEESPEPVIFDLDKLMTQKNKPFYIDFWYSMGAREIVGFPLRVKNECIGAISVYPREKNTFTPEALRIAQGISAYIGIALSNIYAGEQIKKQLEEIEKYRSKLEQEKKYLQEQIKTNYNYENIIGSNNGLRKVFQLIANVAPSESTVLLLGETGTGKELIATAIHNSSSRRDKLLVKVNCAALPANLIESELFGHEKGSFTGALDRRIGKFELANHGTLFLDEIGEMPLELQAKLLRAIQEKEIERIGGKTVIKTDVRIIAASNRNLKKEADAGRFRNDLFYRLNVFPITIPPLRERMEDIPMLVSHFIDKFSQKSGKNVKNVSTKVVQEMMVYDWPGNVRELEHVIERCVLMAQGDTISEINLLQSNKRVSEIAEEHQFKSLEENERSHILAALKRANGRIRGAGGAAELLQLPPTTLHSKMKKLGIRKTGA